MRNSFKKYGLIFHKILRGTHSFIRKGKRFSLALLSKFSMYLIEQNTEHYFARVKIKQMTINIHFKDIPAILIRWNDTRNCSLVQGFTCYCPELAKKGNCAKKLCDYLP